LDGIEGVIEDNKSSCFSLLAAALLARHEQSKTSIADIAAEIAHQLTRRTSWACCVPADPRQGKGPDRLKAIELVWLTLTLLHALSNPSNLTDDELSFYRERLAAEPRVSQFSTSALDAEAPTASLPGTLYDHIGIISGEFVEAAQAEQLIAEIDELGPGPPANEEAARAAHTGLLKCVEQSLTTVLRAMARLVDPLDVYQMLELIPLLASQTVTAARYAGDEDLSTITNTFGQLTGYLLAVRGRKELPGVFGDLIQGAVRNVLTAWSNLSELGISTPPFVRELRPGTKSVAAVGSTGQWICWDFREPRVRPTHYTIKALHLVSWVLEGSQDGENWVEMDRKTGCEDFRLAGTASFGVVKMVGCRFIRLVQTGANHPGTDGLRLESVEFFGTLLQ
jgi:hypothetical protein